MDRYVIVDVEARENLFIVVAEGVDSHVLENGKKKIIVLDVNAPCSTVFHELLHASGVKDEENVQVLERFLAKYFCDED